MFKIITIAMITLTSIGLGMFALALAIGESLSIPSHRLLYMATRGRVSDSEIFMLDVERGLSISVTHERVVDGDLTASPDGEWIIYRPNTETRSFSLINLNTGEHQILPELPDVLTLAAVYIDWLNDGRIGLNFIGSNAMQHIVYDPRSGELNEVADDFAVGAFAGVFDWRVGNIAVPLDDGAEFDDWQMIVVNGEGLPRFLDPNEVGWQAIPYVLGEMNLSLSPDLARFAAVLERNGQTDLYVVPVWEDEPIQLTDDVDRETFSTWSRDGRYIAYITQVGRARELRIMEVTTRRSIYRLDDIFIISNQLAWASAG